MGAGLPRWSAVIDELLDDLILESGRVQDDPIEITADERTAIASSFFRRHAASPLYAARYMRAAFGERFEQRLAHAVYCPNNENCGTQTPPVLAAIARLCAGDRGFSSVVTYNYDDLLERALDEDGVGFETLLSQRRQSNALPIYHVHGWLPRDPVPSGTSADSLLVFSEERYHEIYARPEHWSNVVQLSLLRSNSCAFVGLSLQDPNLRRLLETAHQSPDCPPHYVFVRRTTPRELTDGVIPLRPAVADALIRTHHRMQEKTLAELGLTVIWVDGHDELPDLLRSLAQPPSPSRLGPLQPQFVHTPVERLSTQPE